MNSNDMQKIMDKTCKRIGNMTEAEFEYTMAFLHNYPRLRDNLLDAIHEQDAETVGKAFLLFIYTVNQDDIKNDYEIEQGKKVTVKEENIPMFLRKQVD